MTDLPSSRSMKEIVALPLDVAIREMLRLRNHVSFAELSRIEGFKGRLTLCAEASPNIVLWNGISQEAADILEDLRKSGVFEYRPASWMVYLTDGMALNMPMVKRNVKYKTPHWFPVTLCHP